MRIGKAVGYPAAFHHILKKANQTKKIVSSGTLASDRTSALRRQGFLLKNAVWQQKEKKYV